TPQVIGLDIVVELRTRESRVQVRLQPVGDPQAVAPLYANSCGRAARLRYAGIARKHQFAPELQEEEVECRVPAVERIAGEPEFAADGTSQRRCRPCIRILAAAGYAARIVAMEALGYRQEVGRSGPWAEDQSELGAEDSGPHGTGIASQRVAVDAAGTIGIQHPVGHIEAELVLAQAKNRAHMGRPLCRVLEINRATRLDHAGPLLG